jgi:hypothetical protein
MVMEGDTWTIELPIYGEVESVYARVTWRDEPNSGPWTNQPDQFSVSMLFAEVMVEDTAQNPSGGEGIIELNVSAEDEGTYETDVIIFSVSLIDAGDQTGRLGFFRTISDDSNEFSWEIDCEYYGVE